MTILNSRFIDLFKDTFPVDILKMVYGDGIQRELKVYDTKIDIEGTKFNILAAIDEKFNFDYSLLGITKGMDIFNKNCKGESGFYLANATTLPRGISSGILKVNIMQKI